MAGIARQAPWFFAHSVEVASTMYFIATVQLNINFTHACREHACVCMLMACNFVNHREYFNFARFGSMRSRATVHDNTLEYTLHK